MKNGGFRKVVSELREKLESLITNAVLKPLCSGRLEKLRYSRNFD